MFDELNLRGSSSKLIKEFENTISKLVNSTKRLGWQFNPMSTRGEKQLRTRGQKQLKTRGMPRDKKQFRTRGRGRGRVYKIRGICPGCPPPLGPPLGVMVSSLFKKWSQVVRLITSNFSTAEDLYPFVKYVIMDIERCGLFVEVLITDNHTLNIRLFKLFSSDKNTLAPVVPHPISTNRKHFV